MSELTALRDQLKTGLSGARHEPGTDSGPSLPELAEHIKALKAANTIDAAPQRVRHIKLSAEEPVSARIRRLAESISASEHVTHAAKEAPISLEPLEHSADTLPMTFQERIELARQRKSIDPPAPN